MDIKAKVNEIADKIKGDDKLMDKFKTNPTSAVESLIGADLPDDVINGIVDGVKAKLATSKIGGALKGLF